MGIFSSIKNFCSCLVRLISSGTIMLPYNWCSLSGVPPRNIFWCKYTLWGKAEWENPMRSYLYVLADMLTTGEDCTFGGWGWTITVEGDRSATIPCRTVSIFLFEVSLTVRRSAQDVEVVRSGKVSEISIMSFKINNLQALFSLFRLLGDWCFVKALKETVGLGENCRSLSSWLTCRCFAADAAASSTALAYAPSIGVSAQEVKSGLRDGEDGWMS